MNKLISFIKEFMDYHKGDISFIREFMDYHKEDISFNKENQFVKEYSMLSPNYKLLYQINLYITKYH